MKNIQPTYATFEQAKLLKEKEWQQRTKMVWLDSLGKQHLMEINLSLELNNAEYDAPEQWQVVEWLRVNYDICLWVKPYADSITYQPHWCYINNKDKENNNTFYLSGNASINGSDYKTPQEAYSAAFDYILKELI